MFIRCLTFFLVLISAPATAVNSLSIFYPPPFQQDGVFYSAKKLFPAVNGGLWTLDKTGDIRFYDGQHMLPRRGSAVAEKVRDAVYIGRQFWFISDDTLFRVTPPHKATVERILPTVSGLREIGHSGRHIWISDASHFYIYDTITRQLLSYPLDGMAKQVDNITPEVNHAVKLPNRWVVATTAGSFSLIEGKFRLVEPSRGKDVEVVHYSPRRRELVVGTRRGALIIDLQRSKRRPVRIGDAQVQTIAESKNSYWIGTRNGLFAYDFMTNQPYKIQSSQHDEFSLPSESVHSVVSDGQSGIWIATSKGISYYSILNRLFERTTTSMTDEQSFLGQIHQVVPGSAGSYWLATSQGLYLYQPGDGRLPQRLLPGNVRSLVPHQQGLLLGRDHGVTYYDIVSATEHQKIVPAALSASVVNDIERDLKGVLWMSAESGLIRYWPDDNKVEHLGFNWMLEDQQAGIVTNLYVTRKGKLYIGTDHGLYVYNSNEIHYLAQSAALGRSIDVAESKQGYLWFVNSRGAFVQHPGTQSFEPVALNEPNLLARCVEASGSGIWLTSSKGLSYYSYDGVQQKNFSAPFGLVNNEFLPNICASNKDELLLGSQRGIVRVFSKQLLATSVPVSRVLFSKVLVDGEVYTIGDPTPEKIRLDYTSSVKFKLGVLPDFDQKHLQYRLSGNKEESWNTLEGTELTLSHMAPGDYILSVRTEAQAQKGLTGSAIAICVAYPWYMNPWSMLVLMVVMLLAGVGLYVWRSHRVNHLNARLQQLIATNTRQLVLQHQVLEGNAQNLQREQAILNRYIANITRCAAEYMRSGRDDGTAIQWQYAHDRLADMFSGLLLLDPKTAHIDSQSSVCMQTFLSAAIEYWLSEARSAGLSISLECRADTTLVSLTTFNLQQVFTVLMHYQLESTESGRFVRFIIESRDEHLLVACHVMLSREASSGQVDEELRRIEQLLEPMQSVNQGRFGQIWQDDTLIVTLSWPQFKVVPPEDRLTSVTVPDSQPLHLAAEESPWLNQVYALIEEEFSDPEFTTSTAAKQLYLSERSLQRKFKQQSGRTFTEHLHQVRMDNACKLLVSGKKVAEAAFLSGYNDPSYFSRKFKLYYGLSPSAFLEKAG